MHKQIQHCRNHGGALISALFITALAVVLATALAVQQRLMIHEGNLVMHADQNYLNLQSMQLIAKNNWINSKKYF